ncbi:MAG: carbonic anhydrase [Planctomycetaceae bacterium]
MHTDDSEVFYESSIPFDTNRIRAAAVYCSDGRFGEQFDELMHHALDLPRYDRLAVPGGSACLARHFATYREEEGVAEQLRFLVNVHALERVVLIAHEHCAFYTDRLQISALQLESQQHEDMLKAIKRVHTIGPGLDVQAFFARRNRNGTIHFESVD